MRIKRRRRTLIYKVLYAHCTTPTFYVWYFVAVFAAPNRRKKKINDRHAHKIVSEKFRMERCDS